MIPYMEVSINGGTPIAGWFTMENPKQKCMIWGLPSGKHTKNYGKSPFLLGKSTINRHFQ